MSATVTPTPTVDPNIYGVGQCRAATLPNRAKDREVACVRALPGVIILVHGVNDLGTCYPAQEQGLCQGLNERLSRKDLIPAGYRVPSQKRDEKLEEDPDAVFYRRDDAGYSPVIPFYWGYREQKDFVDKDAPHGQYLDRYGNRLDKSGAQGGGPFANATSTLPDMWGKGFDSHGGVVNTAAGEPTHPLRDGPDRRYMVLAAQRLAALVQAIRNFDRNETVTLIGHSQGCLLSLLAQAFLDDWGERPADCLILNHPPYALEPAFLETLQTTDLQQQTTHARLTTLQNLVRVVTEKPHGQPPLAALNDGTRMGVCGPFWKADKACRYTPGSKDYTFVERDNRGKVYLYFCPEDMTVGLDNVAGIGTFGVPDTVRESRVPASIMTTVSALPTLGNRFFQRVFTMRERGGTLPPVGDQPTRYCLREARENYHDHVPAGNSKALRHVPSVGETRQITGEPLAPPCAPDLHYGESGRARLAVDPIDAAVAITNKGIETRREIIDDRDLAQWNGRLNYPPAMPGDRFDRPLPDGVRGRIEEHLNAGKKVEDRCQVRRATWISPGKVEIVRTETPNEARLRWQSAQSMDNSYHSAIVANPEHSRHVHAFDLAIAQGLSVTNPAYRTLLARLADWRVVTKRNENDNRSSNVVLFKDMQTMPFYADLPERTRKLTEANAGYYTEGTLPIDVIAKEPPEKTVVSQTIGDLRRHYEDRKSRP